MFYAQVGTNGKVHTISSTNNRMVEVETQDDRLMGTNYDPVTKSFVGYKTVLVTNKTSITANGTDTATVTVTVYKWDDTIATDYAPDIVLDVNGVQVTLTPTNGVAAHPVTASAAGSIAVKTVGTEFLANGSTTINAS